VTLCEDNQMRRLLSSVFVVAFSIVGLATAEAGGCVPGVYRDAYDGCKPVRRAFYNGYREGYYERWHDAYFGEYGRYYVVDTGLCWNRGTHRVCSSGWTCWRACN